MIDDFFDPLGREPGFQVRLVARLGAAFLAGRLLLGRGRLRFDGPLRRRAFQAVFKVAELGFQNQDARFQLAAAKALGNGLGDRRLHPAKNAKIPPKAQGEIQMR